MSEQTAAKVTGAHLARTAYLYLLTELPQGSVRLRGRAVVGVVMVPVRDRQRRGRPGSHVVNRATGRPPGRVRRCVGAVAATRPGGRGCRAGRGVAARFSGGGAGRPDPEVVRHGPAAAGAV